jgi:DNA-binding NarL/FixJ family response regulator
MAGLAEERSTLEQSRSTEESVTRVLVAAQVRLYCEGLEAVLACEDAIEVVGVGTSGQETITRVGEARPDVVVLDPTLPHSIDLIRELTRSGPAVKVIVLAPPHAEGEVLACAEAGVSGYVTYDSSVEQLVGAIGAVRRGELLCSPSIAGALLRRVNSLAASLPREAPQQQLTAREIEIARLLDEGLSNKQIAYRLCIQLATVKHHVHHILAKVDARRRSEAVARLRVSGLLQG